MVPKCELLKNILLHGQGLNYRTCVCKLEDTCWGKGIEFELTNKAWARKKISSFKFALLHVIKHLNQIYISLCPITQHKRAKQDTIGVVGGTSANLPHCIGHVLTYPMENKMSFVHHVIKQWRCGYKNEDDKGLSERT
jgi:hypothetical protein